MMFGNKIYFTGNIHDEIEFDPPLLFEYNLVDDSIKESTRQLPGMDFYLSAVNVKEVLGVEI